MVSGIDNIGSSCYIASFLQCLRRSYGVEFPLPMDLVTGRPEDPNEFFMIFVEKHLSIDQKNKILVKFSDNSSLPFIIVDGAFANNMSTISSVGDIVCLYRNPSRIDLQSCLKLQTRGKMYDLTSFVCYTNGHYYSCVENDGSWLLCNDAYVSNLTHVQHNIYMLFYTLSK